MNFLTIHSYLGYNCVTGQDNPSRKNLKKFKKENEEAMKDITNSIKAFELGGGAQYFCKVHKQWFSSYGKAWWHCATRHVEDWAGIWANLVVKVFS